MILHTLKIIWNERRSNLWIILEYVLVFIILWFCVDYTYTILKAKYSPDNFDVKNTYALEFGEKITEVLQRDGFDRSMVNEYELFNTVMERIRNHPDVEIAAFGWGAHPHSGSYSSDMVLLDKIPERIGLQRRAVTPEFFDLFRIKMIHGRALADQDYSQNSVVLSTLKGDIFYNDPISGKPVKGTDIKNIYLNNNDTPHQVVGIAAPIRRQYFNPLENSYFRLIPHDELIVNNGTFLIRTKPGTSSDFTKRFIREMRDQLSINPYFIRSIEPIDGMDVRNAKYWGYTSRINGVYAVVMFIVVNIFLGILGTFWFRTQSRRSEIGLRVALGSRRSKIKGLLALESMLLLSVAAIIASILCLQISGTNILRELGIPTINRQWWHIGNEQDIINFLITFGFLAIVSLLAVWYPARQASRQQPAESLHEE